MRVKASIYWYRILKGTHLEGDGEGEDLVICPKDTWNTSDKCNIVNL
jgi:hypothetical protein